MLDTPISMIEYFESFVVLLFVIEREESAKIEKQEKRCGNVGQERSGVLETLGDGQSAILNPPALRFHDGRLSDGSAEQTAQKFHDFVVVAGQFVEMHGIFVQSLRLRVSGHQFDDLLRVHLFRVF